ncbi:hypothetical protein CDD83_10125 [Cordyceps sp. RAO-2017]|nr:hypothetical protein CDD83_10125 [Cordyceps sp. RAO-2017]
MSERKVLQKYYPPDFDYRQIWRSRGPKQTGPRVQDVRLMAPFTMRCTTCGEFIYRGRKFNSRKVTHAEEKYLGIQCFFFHIKCTRCSAEIIFKTDPKNRYYTMVAGAVRNMEPWRDRDAEEETMEQRLDRLEMEEAEAAGEEEKNAMADLEAKNADTQREMAVADALDKIRQRNARINISEKDNVDYADLIVRAEDEERARQEKEDSEAASKAFSAARSALSYEMVDDASDTDALSIGIQTGPGDETTNGSSSGPISAPAVTASAPSFKRVVKKKKNHSALLGIKKKPSLV